MHKAPQFSPLKTLTLQPIINLKPIYFELLLYYKNFIHAPKITKEPGVTAVALMRGLGLQPMQLKGRIKNLSH